MESHLKWGYVENRQPKYHVHIKDKRKKLTPKTSKSKNPFFMFHSKASKDTISILKNLQSLKMCLLMPTKHLQDLKDYCLNRTFTK